MTADGVAAAFAVRDEHGGHVGRLQVQMRAPAIRAQDPGCVTAAVNTFADDFGGGDGFGHVSCFPSWVGLPWPVDLASDDTVRALLWWQRVEPVRAPGQRRAALTERERMCLGVVGFRVIRRPSVEQVDGGHCATALRLAR